MPDALIIDAVRTPVGRHGGALASVRPDDLAAIVLKALIERTKIDPAIVEEVYFGCANQAGEDNRNVARMAALLAGFPYEVPAVTFNRLCASSLAAINTAARAIKVGDGEVYIAGGVESMSRAPWSFPKATQAFPFGNVTAYDTALGWRYPNEKMEAKFPLESMGETAENIYERQPEITREEQDRFAYDSQMKAKAAIESGRFKDEIVPVSIPQRKGDPLVVATDEHPRPETTLDGLAKLKPAFRKNGSVTAGNASGLNDGAAAVLLMTAGARERPWSEAIGAHHRRCGGGCRSARDGPRPDPGDAQSFAARGPHHRSDRSVRDQRSLRRAVDCVRERTRHPERETQRQRRSDRVGASVGLFGRAHRHDAGA